MSGIRRAAIRHLASAAYEIGLEVKTGRLELKNGRWYIDQIPLENLLTEYANQEVTLVLGSYEDTREIRPKSCPKCGKDYTDLECPSCRSNRIRLRGR